MKRRHGTACECKAFLAETVYDGRCLCHLCAHAVQCKGDALADCDCPREARYPALVLMRIDVAVAAGVLRARQESGARVDPYRN